MTCPVEDRHAEDVLRAVVECHVDAGIETAVRVSVGNVDRFSRRCHRTRDTTVERQTDFIAFDVLRNQGEELLAIAVYEKHGAAIDVNLFSNNLKNDSRQLGEINGRIQKLGSFEQAPQTTGASSIGL